VKPPHPALWSKDLGAGDIGGIAFDSSGNLVIAGGLGPESHLSIPKGYVAAFDRSGNLEWQHQWSSMGESLALSVALGNGAIWVLGASFGNGLETVDLGGAMISVPAATPSTGSNLLVRYDTAGAYLSSAALVASWIGLDAIGNVFSVTSVPSSSGAGRDATLTKASADGTTVWTLSVANGSPVPPAINGSGTLAAFGDFGAGADGAVPTTRFATIAPSGSISWSRAIPWSPAIGSIQPGAIALDDAGNVTVGGTFSGQLDLGGPAPLVGPSAPSSDPGRLSSWRNTMPRATTSGPMCTAAHCARKARSAPSVPQPTGTFLLPERSPAASTSALAHFRPARTQWRSASKLRFSHG
jgi:hypothetical protein